MGHPLVGVVQLLLLVLFVASVMYLNTFRPARTHYRPFRINWWVPTVAGVMAVLLLASLVNLPHHLQHTNPLVARRHAEGREECRSLMDAGALHAERAALFGSEFFHDKSAAKPPAAAKRTVFDFLSPLLNMLLFNSGVTICAVPLLLYLLSLHLRRPAVSRGSGQQWLDLLRRESGVLLPVLNFISLVSAFTSPTFYLFIQPGRVDRCIYTSGHWFTFSITLLTFAVIVAHLASYQQYCRSSGQLLALYVVWLAVYAMCALSVLKKTQEAFHDSLEATDGIRQGLPAFAIYMLFFIGLQYVTFQATDTADKSDDDTAQATAPAVATDSTQQLSSAATLQPLKQAASTPIATSPAERAAPEPASVDSAIPDAPPPPPPSAPAPAAPTRTTVTKRKTAAPAPPPVTDSRSDLLDAIKRGPKLRASGGRGGGGQASELTGLAKILAETRKVLQPDGEEDDEAWE